MAQKSDDDARRMTRRRLIIAGSAAVATIALKLRNGSETVEAKGNVPKEVKIVQFSDTGAAGSSFDFTSGCQKRCGVEAAVIAGFTRSDSSCRHRTRFFR